MELAQLIQAVDEVVTDYDERIEGSSNVAERKQLRSERAYMMCEN